DGSIRGLEEIQPPSVIAFESLTLIVICLVALLGNTLVVVVVHRSRRVQSTTNYFVTSIAFSDALLVLFSAPFVCAQVVVQEWPAGRVTCRVVRFLQFAAMSTTSFVLVAICIDRFYTVIYPLTFKVTRGTAKRMIVFAWVVSILISSLCIYFFDLVEVKDGREVNATRPVCPTLIPAKNWSGVFYAILCVTSQFLCPLVMVSIGYSRILWYVRTARNRARRSRRSEIPVPRTKVKMVKMLFSLTFITLMFYLPYYATQTVYCFSYRDYFSGDVFIASFWIICASAAVKPVIYACKNSNFWRGCQEVLCMSTMRCYRLNTYAVTRASTLGKRNYVGVLDLAKEQVSVSIESPVDVYNRNKYLETSGWSLQGSLPTTSL
ncbi:unnamed protein product, partial [Lymnaea stagnalis]